MFEHFHPSLLSDPSFKEDAVREVLIAPMLAKLGYHASGTSRVIRSKALKHPFIYAGTRRHPVTLIPDYTLLHQERPVLILDAKSPTENVLGIENVQQAYSYAIHPEIKCDHFALCNGKTLALFSVNKSEPLLAIDFHEFLSKWEIIEKHLLPKYLIEPSLRNFWPDLGFKLQKMGIGSDTELIMQKIQLERVGRVDTETFTAAATVDFSGSDHCASFDFGNDLITPIAAGLPERLAHQFLAALSRAPFQAAADKTIEIDVVARLGSETAGQHESFVPILLTKVLDSRFEPNPPGTMATDIPSHIFRLRGAI